MRGGRPVAAVRCADACAQSPVLPCSGIMVSASARLARNRSARSSTACSALRGIGASQRGDRVHAVEEEMRADARLQCADARQRFHLDAALPFGADIEVAQRQCADDEADGEVAQQESPRDRLETRRWRRRSRRPRCCPTWYTSSETMPTVATSMPIAIVAARVAGICCSHGRARHNTAAHPKPDPQQEQRTARQVDPEVACSAWRAIAKMIATSSMISTTASTAQPHRSPGERICAFAAPRASLIGRWTSRRRITCCRVRLESLAAAANNRVLQTEQGRDVLVAMALLDQPAIMHAASFRSAAAARHDARPSRGRSSDPSHASARGSPPDSCRGRYSARD